MAANCWTKQDLYLEVDSLINQLTFQWEPEDFPINPLSLAYEHCLNLSVEIVDFGKLPLCAILSKGSRGTSISLSKGRSETMQRFDCMHELIHYFFHHGPNFYCLDKNTILQNAIQEWQANEGAAQALVPYQIFIPEYVSRIRNCTRNQWNMAIIHNELAQFFNVTTIVIRNRISSLEYEIYQHLQGVPVSELVVLSKKQLSKYGLDKLVEHRMYCTNCHAIVDIDDDYCDICGMSFATQHDFPDQKTYSGVDYMVHQGIDIDENGRAVRCPVCDNEEIDGQHCKICGAGIINYCTNDNNCSYGNPLEGNARFCHHCGGKSFFYQNGYLKPWDEPEDEIPF